MLSPNGGSRVASFEFSEALAGHLAELRRKVLAEHELALNAAAASPQCTAVDGPPLFVEGQYAVATPPPSLRSNAGRVCENLFALMPPPPVPPWVSEADPGGSSTDGLVAPCDDSADDAHSSAGHCMSLELSTSGRDVAANRRLLKRSRSKCSVVLCDCSTGWASEQADEVGHAKLMLGELFDNSSRLVLNSCFFHWRDHVGKLKTGEIYDDEEELRTRRIQAALLWPTEPWGFDESPTGELSQATVMGGASTSGMRQVRTGDVNVNTRRTFLQRFVALPTSKKRMTWDFFSFVLVGYDVFMIPMSVFELSSSLFLVCMSWISTAFWTIDLPSSFFVSFYNDGVVEMRPIKIAQHYLKTWFFLDLVVVSVDWLFILLRLDDTQAHRWTRLRISRISRVWRILRIIRLLRVAKVYPRVTALFDDVQSDRLRQMLGALKAVSFIVVINHMVACSWFALGDLNDEDRYTWVTNAGVIGPEATVERSHWTYQFATSLHWAWCQFTPASMEVFPVNVRERVFCVFVVVFGLLTFSSFVSSLTTAMTQLRNFQSDRIKEDSAMKRYFKENKVSVELGKSIIMWIQAYRRKRTRRVHEADITALVGLPSRLMIQLHQEVYGPMLTLHPFFAAYSEIDTKGLHRICHCAMSQQALLDEQDLFTRGTTATKMYFIVSGLLDYLHEGSHKLLEEGNWACEVVLWIPWVHLGNLTAIRFSELFALDAGIFQKTIPQCSKMIRRLIRAYAALYVRHTCVDHEGHKYEWITDICCPARDRVEMVQTAKQSMSRSARTLSPPEQPEARAPLTSAGDTGKFYMRFTRRPSKENSHS